MNSMRRILLVVSGLLASSPALAVDSYRYLHVTIDTPWAIFLFLLPIVLSPFILMVILYWRFAIRKKNDQQSRGDDGVGNDTAGK